MTIAPTIEQQEGLTALRKWFSRELTLLKKRQRNSMKEYDQKKKVILQQRLKNLPQDESYASRSEE